MADVDRYPNLLNLNLLREYQNNLGAENGKFIRIGHLIFIGPMLRHDIDQTTHLKLLNGAKDVLGLRRQAVVDASREPQLTTPEGFKEPMHDAGSFVFMQNQTIDPFTKRDLALEGRDLLRIGGISSTYNRANEAGRELTGELAQEVLGDLVLVQPSTETLRPH